MVMRDIACAGYVAGGNVRWFAKDAEGAGYSAETARDNLVSRLSFDDDVSDRYASMLAFPAFEGQFQGGHLDTVMSITGRLLPWEVTGASNLTHKSFPGGEQMFQQYNKLLNLHQVHYGEDLKAAENMDFISQGSTNVHPRARLKPSPTRLSRAATDARARVLAVEQNATCFLGPHRRFDPFTKSFMSLIPGQGHFGPDAIPGDARWRRGESVSLKTARDSMERCRHSNPRPRRAVASIPTLTQPLPSSGRPRARPARADGVHAALVSALRGLAKLLFFSCRASKTRDCRSSVGSQQMCVCVCVLGKAYPFLIIPSGGG